jgi:MFS transporter, PAT family, beta-lactamase induction signal transducer AmpG
MSEANNAWKGWTNPRILLMASLSLFGAIPFQIVFNTMPTWLAADGVLASDIGLFSVATLPWSFKFVWAPLIDRYRPPFAGRRRGWMLIAQASLLFAIAAVPFMDPKNALMVIAIGTAIAFLSATHDIALDAYAVELMQPQEQGPGNAMRTTFYRIGMLAAGGVAIAAAGVVSWKIVFIAIALVMLPGMLFVSLASEPPQEATPLPSLGDAIVLPFLTFFRKERAVAIMFFVLLYKFGDNMVQTMLPPFFVQELGVTLVEIGFAQKTVGMGATIAGALLGGALIPRIGLGRALWIFGLLQASVNITYAATAWTGGVRPMMYAAIALEHSFAGMTTAALLTLITRLCDKRLAATQFALLTSIYALGRTLAGPPSGFIAEQIGFGYFFLVTMAASVPGLALLALIPDSHTKEVAS